MSDRHMTPILPRGQGEDRPLIIIMAIMSFLATLSLLLVLMGVRQSDSWQKDLQSAATVQVTGANQIMKSDEALAILKNQPGVTGVSVLSESENRALLNPWIGDVTLPNDITVPTLIRLSVDQKKFKAKDTEDILSQAGISATVDNHRQWSKNLSSTWNRIRLALFSLLAIILAATIGITTFATRSVIQVRKNIIQVLGQVGATDSFIGGLFVKRFLTLGLKSAILGIVAALIFIVIFMIWQNSGTDENGLKISLEIGDFLWLTIFAFVMGAICALTAGVAARKSIQGRFQNS